MDAKVGDRFVIKGHVIGQPDRDALILSVGPGGSPPYRVRWSEDGHESLVWPGPDAKVEHLERARRRVRKA